MVTVHKICLDADLFRAAYPHWPSPEPEPVGAVYGQGEITCPASHETAGGWLYCNREDGHTEFKHLDGRTNQEWDAAEPDCPDCGAPPGRSCYPDCLRYAEGV